MKRLFTMLIASALLPLLSFAQMQTRRQQLNAAEVQHALRGLRTFGSVLYWAAHPDDENTRLIAYLSRGRHIRTGYFSLTRGDGGQNLIGTEQDYLLGILRTQELLAARRIDGGEQYFSRAWDFGYSKTAEETFQKWDKQLVLADAVWMIRKFRPDVIVTRFPPDERAGHGHHTASAMLAEEAFKLAGDPKAFPEQLAFVQPWQPKRLYWNTAPWAFNKKEDFKTDKLLKINVGEYDPLLGKSYVEIAAAARSQHRCQAFGTAPERGVVIEYLQHTLGDSAKMDLMDGVKSTWKDYGLPKIDEELKEAEQAFALGNRTECLEELEEVHDLLTKALAKPQTSYDVQQALQRKQKDLESAILQVLGIWFEAIAETPTAASGDSVKVKVFAINRSEIPAAFSFALQDKSVQWDTLANNMLNSKELKISLQNIALTQPYWLRNPVNKGMFDVPESERAAVIGLPETPEPLVAQVRVSLHGRSFTLPLAVAHKFVDRSIGEIYRPFIVTPEVTTTLSDKSFVWGDDKPHRIEIRVLAHTNVTGAKLKIELPQGWKASPEVMEISQKKGEEKLVSVEITPTSAASQGKMRIVTELPNGKFISNALQTVQYEHIPTQLVFPMAEAKVVRVDIQKKGTKIGYLVGAGDDVPAALRQVGYDVTLLQEKDITPDALRGFDAVISGVRAYNNTVKNIAQLHKYLMEYVQQGGTYIVQYNTSYDLQVPAPGPYPFKISRDRVTVEEAPMKLLVPEHPVFTTPNRISEQDFAGWIQERGIYFASEWDAQYTPLLESADPKEKPTQGALLYAPYGKGHYFYTGLVFFRELPAGVPGAYRLLANMLSVGK